MKILVTGGNGLVGNSIKKLVNNYNSHEFVFLKRDECELTNRENVLKYFENNKFDYIIHLAAHVGGLFMNMNSNIDMFSKNIKINENILEACHKNNIKKGIFCLSSCIYPCNPSKFPMDETMIHESPPHYSNEGYAYSKRMLELQCRQYNNKYNTQYICVIPVNLYGPYDNFNIENGHVIPSILHRFHMEKISKNENYFAYGTGNPYRQFLYAPDFARIICNLLLDNIYTKNEPIICCNDEITIKEMTTTLLEVMHIDNKLLKWNTNKSDGCLKKTVTNEKLLKYYPDFEFTSLKKGLTETYNWFCNNQSIVRK